MGIRIWSKGAVNSAQNGYALFEHILKACLDEIAPYSKVSQPFMRNGIGMRMDG